jgi:dienelactone hydrolase
MMPISRRAFLECAVLTALAPPLAACAGQAHDRQPPSLRGFDCLDGFERTMLRTGPRTGAPILLLHELPGMTPEDMDLARHLGTDGFSVYLPLLFGAVGQHNARAGYRQSCQHDEFVCHARSTRSPILDYLGRITDKILEDAGPAHPLGIIGMCLTGILPLALLRPRVEAAVLCQPTVPFTTLALGRPIGRQKKDLGLGPDDLQHARGSHVPMLLTHYLSDHLCPPDRVQVIEDTFSRRVATIGVAGKGHSTLATDCSPPAYADTVRYLRVRLGMSPGPQAMTVATFEGKPCELRADGTWNRVD